MKHKEKLGKRIIHAFEMDEIIDARDALEMRGMNELTVREVGRFLHYSETEIRLSLKEYVLVIRGDELYCTSYLGGIVRVCGEINQLDIRRREGGGKNGQKQA